MLSCVDCGFLLNAVKKKPPPKAGALKTLQSVSLLPLRELFSSQNYNSHLTGTVPVLCEPVRWTAHKRSYDVDSWLSFTETPNSSHPLRPDRRPGLFYWDRKLSFEHCNQQWNGAQCDHAIEPGFSAVFTIDIVNPLWNAISCKDDGNSQNNDKWDS